MTFPLLVVVLRHCSPAPPPPPPLVARTHIPTECQSPPCPTHLPVSLVSPTSMHVAPTRLPGNTAAGWQCGAQGRPPSRVRVIGGAAASLHPSIHLNLSWVIHHARRPPTLLRHTRMHETRTTQTKQERREWGETRAGARLARPAHRLTCVDRGAALDAEAMSGYRYAGARGRAEGVKCRKASYGCGSTGAVRYGNQTRVGGGERGVPRGATERRVTLTPAAAAAAGTSSSIDPWGLRPGRVDRQTC